MKLELEVTFRLHPELLALLAPLFHPRMSTPAKAPQQTAAAPGGVTSGVNAGPDKVDGPDVSTADPVPVKRGPGRPRKEQPAAAILPGPGTAAPQQTAAPTTPAESGVTLATLAKMMTPAMQAAGVPAVRELLAEFKASALPKLTPDQYPAFAARLQELTTMVGG